MNIIGLNGKPQVRDIKSVLKEWLSFRTETVKRRLQYRLDWVLDRLHILEGLMAIYLNIDEVIHIIRNEDEPKQILQKKFKLSIIQVEAILEIRLRQLAKLEEIKIQEEQGKLDSERKDLETTLSSKARLKTLIKNELKADINIYGDDRKSPIVSRDDASAFDETELISSDPVTVILSKRGWVRAAKGHDVEAEKLNYREGDEFFASAKGRNNQNAVFLDSKGKAYTLPCHLLPSARGQGEPLTGKLNAESGETFAGVVSGSLDSKVVLATNAGYGFVARLGDLQTKNKSGKAALRVTEGAKVLPPQLVASVDAKIAAITNIGKLLVFPISELPELYIG
jgi:topoisomerase-4 subunit A